MEPLFWFIGGGIVFLGVLEITPLKFWIPIIISIYAVALLILVSYVAG